MAGRVKGARGGAGRASEPLLEYGHRKPQRGEIWIAELQKPDKVRPVLVISRAALAETADSRLVASVTSTRRGLPFEVPVTTAEGLKRDLVVNLTNIHTLDASRFRRHVGGVSSETMRAVCRALAIATGCD